MVSPMKKMFLAGCSAVMTLCVAAEVCDLNGTDKEVSSLAYYPDGFTNTSGTLATLTLVIDNDVTYNGPISGNIRLVKKGVRDLTIDQPNTFTGGTEIYNGRLIAAHPSALGSGEVYVESDCSKPFSYANQGNLSALTIACASFTNDLRVSKWSSESPSYESTCLANYNLQLARENSRIRFYGNVSGGSLSVFCGVDRAANTPVGVKATQFADFYGAINCEGTVYHLSAFVVNYLKSVSCSRLTGPSDFWCRMVNLFSNSNQIRETRIGAGHVICNMKNCLRGSEISGSSHQDSSHPEYAGIDMVAYSQEIDRFVQWQSIGSRKNRYPHVVSCTENKGVVLTMRATGDSECDWNFENDVSLCWWPTDSAYKMSCIADRNSSTKGAITVSNGVFEITGTYTFSNVTAVAVCEGASFENNSSIAGALKSVKNVRIDKGGFFKLGRADAMTLEDVVFNVDTDSVIEIPDGCAIDVKAICFAGNGLPVGTYTGKDSTVAGATPIPQLKGSGLVYVLSSPKADVVEATWSDGAGNGLFETTGNWNNPAVAGRFQDGVINATFASAGSEAMVTDAEVLNKVAFNGGVQSFTLKKGGDSAAIVLGAGGLAAVASSAMVVTNEVPMTIAGSQDWLVGDNLKLCMTGGLRQIDSKPALLSITGGVNDNRQLMLFGRGDLGTYAGRVDIKGNIVAVGDDPFGRATEGVDGTVTLYGGNAGKLLLGKRGGPVTTITKPFSLSGGVGMGYLQLANSSWRAGEAYKTRVSFLGPVDFNSDSTFDLNGFQPNVIFAGGGKMLSKVMNSAGSVTVTNKPMVLSFRNTDALTLKLYLNVSNNKMDAFTPKTYANDIYFGAEWALYEGNTTMDLQFHWGDEGYYGSTIQLNGYNQRIGTLSSRMTKPSGATKSPFDVTPVARSQITSTRPATLYVNQTSDRAMIVPFTGNVALCKEGPATLMISNVDCTATSPLTVTAGTLELFDASWKNATAVTVTALETNATLKLSTKFAAADVSANKYFTRKAFNLTMTDGDGFAKLDLAEGVYETADTFVLNGKMMDGGRTYGSSVSTAEVKDDCHFVGKGVLRVAHPCGVLLIVR